MQTGAISFRVADFLKQYPPFQFMETLCEQFGVVPHDPPYRATLRQVAQPFEPDAA